MIVFAPAKINMGLRIIGKRNDGFHHLESYLYPVPLYDILEMLPSTKDELIQTGINSHTSIADNIVFTAVRLLRQDYQIPYLRIHLHKQIPVESGLGGGSSDAVAVLKMLDTFFKLSISEEQMYEYAKTLGSDCPFFIKGIAAKITGRGEYVTTCNVSLKGRYVMIIKPDFSISTSKAFSRIIQFNTVALPKWESHSFSGLSNDFEDVLGEEKRTIDKIKGWMREQGAVYTSMSGSGSAVFGIFDKRVDLPFHASYFQWVGSLQ